jgi:flavin reductase (DIM6/NTAB) family NADH-FMN oxidoreductase RutF
MTKLEDGTHHGATLSSFTSISLSPPLVSFSLRLPSRLATALQSPFPQSSTNAPKELSEEDKEGKRFTVSLLSQSHIPLAQTFSQAQESHEALIRDETQWESLTFPGLPLVRSPVGGLDCRVVKWMDLKSVVHGGQEGEQGGSMLFIAKVVAVAQGKDEGVKSLVYENQGYVTTTPS